VTKPSSEITIVDLRHPKVRVLDEIFITPAQLRCMNSKILYLVVALSLAAGAALAEPATPAEAPVVEANSLTEDQLREAIIGKTIYLTISGFELPIYYKSNGRMTGSMGQVAAAFSRGDGSHDSGRWWIEANQLCQRWTSWMDGQTNCYKITRQSNLITWIRQDGVSGTARIED